MVLSQDVRGAFTPHEPRPHSQILFSQRQVYSVYHHLEPRRYSNWRYAFLTMTRPRFGELRRMMDRPKTYVCRIFRYPWLKDFS